MTDIDSQIEVLIRARYPIVYILSWEERRVIDALAKIAEARGKKLFVWTITMGLTQPLTTNPHEATKDPLVALDAILQSKEPAIFVLKDFHAFMDDITTIRKLRDLTYSLKTSFKTLVIISPTLKLPTELEKEVTVVDYSLPTLSELDTMLEGIIQSVRDNPQINTKLAPEQREHVLKAALGLTASEAENVFAKSLVEKRKFDVDTIVSEKEQIIRKSGILEYYPATDKFDDVGGLDILKGWLKERGLAFSENAREFGLPQPKGILLLGVQGCGKSLTAKSVASLWKLPLLRLDLGKVFSGVVGSSEENIRKAVKIAESVSPSVLWIDEIEKGLAGTQSSAFSDAGTTARVFGSFITWLQEKDSPVFVIATANDINLLPPELLRKGRFDEIFFVDLPSPEERKEIFEIHLCKRQRDPSKFNLDKLAETAANFSGAEIEQAVISAMYAAFYENREVTTEDIIEAINETIPLAKTMKEQIDELRNWAETRARPASSTPEEAVITEERKIEL